MNQPPGPSAARTYQDEPSGQSSLLRPGLVVVALGLLLIVIVAVGVILNSRGDASAGRVTIADLRADPERFDNSVVEITGRAENVRELPYLSQYAVYEIRDETGAMYVLTQRGAPPDSIDGSVRLKAVYHSSVTLDDELRRLVEERLGSIAGAIVGAIVPGVELNVVFLEHQSYGLLFE